MLLMAWASPLLGRVRNVTVEVPYASRQEAAHAKRLTVFRAKSTISFAGIAFVKSEIVEDLGSMNATSAVIQASLIVFV